MQRKLVWFIAAPFGLMGAFALGLWIGSPGEPTPSPPTGETADDWRNRDALEISPAVRDAVARWKAKTGDDLSDRNIQIMGLPDRMCIKLAFKNISVGGEPVYCYREYVDGQESKETIELVYDGSNVE